MIKRYKENEIKELANILKNDGVISVPTDTVYGVCARISSIEAYNKLMQVKERPTEKLFPIMCADEEQIKSIAIVDEKAEKLIRAFMPGPITLLLPSKNDLPNWVTHGGSTVGIRMPSNEIGLALLKIVEKPLLVPSANRSGEKPALNSKEVADIFDKEVDFIISGEANLDKPSTIIDLTGKEIKVVREGPITLEQINDVLKY